MASFKQGIIRQASLHETPVPNASRDSIEATPLLSSNDQKYGKKKTVLIKSKAAIMILIWIVLMYFVYGFILNPEIYFLFSYFMKLLLGYSPVITNEVIASCVYAVFAICELFYPLAGYLADIRYGRYKVVRCGICTMWCGLLAVVVIGGIVNAIIIPITLTIKVGMILPKQVFLCLST